MAASDTEIANLALTHLGIAKEIANLETEDSQEANAIRRLYATVRDEILREWAWPFSTVFVTLALVEKNPTNEWDFSYRYPADCLKIRRILSGVRQDTHQSRVPYKIIQDAAGLLIYTDTEDAMIEYTKRETDPQKYPSDFVLSFSFKLAALAAGRITAGDRFGLGSRALQLYEWQMSKAKAQAGNEEQPDQTPDSEFIRSREG